MNLNKFNNWQSISYAVLGLLKIKIAIFLQKCWNLKGEKLNKSLTFVASNSLNRIVYHDFIWV